MCLNLRPFLVMKRVSAKSIVQINENAPGRDVILSQRVREKRQEQELGSWKDPMGLMEREQTIGFLRRPERTEGV